MCIWRRERTQTTDFIHFAIRYLAITSQETSLLPPGNRATVSVYLLEHGQVALYFYFKFVISLQQHFLKVFSRGKTNKFESLHLQEHSVKGISNGAVAETDGISRSDVTIKVSSPFSHLWIQELKNFMESLYEQDLLLSKSLHMYAVLVQRRSRDRCVYIDAFSSHKDQTHPCCILQNCSLLLPRKCPESKKLPYSNAFRWANRLKEVRSLIRLRGLHGKNHASWIPSDKISSMKWPTTKYFQGENDTSGKYHRYPKYLFCVELRIVVFFRITVL